MRRIRSGSRRNDDEIGSGGGVKRMERKKRWMIKGEAIKLGIRKLWRVAG